MKWADSHIAPTGLRFSRLGRTVVLIAAIAASGWSQAGWAAPGSTDKPQTSLQQTSLQQTDSDRTGLVRPAIALAVGALAPATVPSDAMTAGIYDAVAEIYGRHDRAPVWWTSDQDVEQVRSIVADLAAMVSSNGLVESDYPFDAIGTLTRFSVPTVGDMARADVLLTLAVVRYAQQVRYGRLDPRAVNEILDYPVRTGDLARSVEFVAAGDIAARLSALAPSHAGYDALRDLLGEIRRSGSWAIVGAGPVLRPGDEDPRIPALRQRLAATDGYRLRPHSDLQNPVYDDRLAVAMRRFQARHGLDVDGLVGAMTQQALDVSPADRAQQVAMNMERWRWLPDHLGSDHLMVNIPDYHVSIVEQGQVALRMPVIVGRTDRKTPLFSSRLTWLEFNPTWTLTQRIAEEDLLPHLIENSNYLADNNIKMFATWQNDAPEITSSFINWQKLGKGIRYFRLRQGPGPSNPLGRVKFMMENSFSVYLHDTNHRDLFDKDARPFSSGCIRVADPRWLASYLLNRPELWTQEQQDEPFGDWETRRVILKRPMPIHLAYFTQWTDADGAVQVRDDIYGFDAEMADIWDQVNEPSMSLASLR